MSASPPRDFRAAPAAAAAAATPGAETGEVSRFLRRHFRHFNARTLVAAAQGWRDLLAGDGRMLLTLAGAMSTAEIGVSLAEMIRRGKVHAISCTGANLEEDLFLLVARDHYEAVPHYRELTPQMERELLLRKQNRVTDVCIPEEQAMRRVERAVGEEWRKAEAQGQRRFPHEFLYRVLRSGALAQHYQGDPRDCWLLAAAEADLPLFVPGWEDSTLGNMFAALCMNGTLQSPQMMRGGVEYFIELAHWYRRSAGPVGFFQIGGGIAGDFPICVVPMLEQDLKLRDVPRWAYFCQISDSTTSYGSYSGAAPNEKITWGKLEVETPKFVIESDASVVAPLVFAIVLGA